MLHFRPSSPRFHDTVNPHLSLDIFLVAVAQPGVDSPTDIHLSQEDRVVGISGSVSFRMRRYLLGRRHDYDYDAYWGG